jgi:retron-type reverse transcriptase
MRRHKHLYERIISFQNLLLASRLAARAKRFKIKTARFNLQLERELWGLHYQLETKTYEPGAYQHFWIYEPKKRLISAAPYRDRVVHHAIHNILEPIFDPTFIHDSYATRKNKGTHAAIDRFQEFAKKSKYALKCDIRQYFPSINRQIVFSLIQRKVACPDTLWLIQKIILFGGQSPQANDQSLGIPIGNLTSQFFANIYLDGLDHFIKEKLRCKYYLRYMDDFVVLHDDKSFLWLVKKDIQDYLEGLHLQLHENKCRIFSTDQGIPFLGQVVSSSRRRLKRDNVIRFKRRMRCFQYLYGHRKIDWKHLHQSIQSWIGHAKHADSYRLRELIFGEFVFKRFDQEGD